MRFYRFFNRLYQFLKELFAAFSADNCFHLSAALAYYAALSLAPMLIIVIAVAGSFFGKEAVSDEIYAQATAIIGETAAKLILDLLQHASLQSGSLKATLISAATILIGATTVFAVLHEAFNIIWKVDKKQRNNFTSFFRRRALGLGILIIIGALLITVLFAQTFLDVFYKIIAKIFTHLPLLAFDSFVNNALFLSVLFLWITLIFKTCSDAKVKWRLCFKGAVFTVTLLFAGRWLISFYLSESNLGSVYGAAGSLVIILTWIYYSAAIVLLGAEFIKLYAKTIGEAIETDEDALPWN